jgi:hypothetical protein
MMYKARDLEREYGAPLRWLHSSQKSVMDAWHNTTSGKRNPDVYHRIEKSRCNHVKLMKARVHSERLPEDAPVPDDVRFWRAVDSTYKRAVEAGLWKSRKEPRSAPLPNHQRVYFKVGKQIRSVRMDPVSPRVENGINFLVREKMMVWKLVQDGRIKLKD